MTKIYIFKHYPPLSLPHSFGPGTFALNSHTYNPLFEKILDQPLFSQPRSQGTLLGERHGNERTLVSNVLTELTLVTSGGFNKAIIELSQSC